MGTLIGHIVPGSLFIIFGLWHTYNILYQFSFVKRTNSQGGGSRLRRAEYQHVTSHPFRCCPKIPLEPILKVAGLAIAITGEYITAFKHGKFTHIGNAQHMTMYLFFAIHAIVELLTYFRAPLPPHMNLVSLCLAFVIEGFLFFFHLHGRTPMDIQVHIMLFYVVVACAVSVFFMIRSPNNVMPALCLCFFIMLQGTWFCQVGFILYPPSGIHWNEESHTEMMWVTLIFTWHAALIFSSMLVLSWMLYKRVQYASPTSSYRTLNPLTSNSNTNGGSHNNYKTVRDIIEDSDEEEIGFD